MFLDLNAARPMGMTASAITYEAIDAYSRLRGIELSPFEVDALRQLDMAWFKVRSQQNG